MNIKYLDYCTEYDLGCFHGRSVDDPRTREPTLHIKDATFDMRLSFLGSVIFSVFF